MNEPTTYTLKIRTSCRGCAMGLAGQAPLLGTIVSIFVTAQQEDGGVLTMHANSRMIQAHDGSALGCQAHGRVFDLKGNRTGSGILEEFVAERDAMHGRAKRGPARDDEYTGQRWIKSLLAVLEGGYAPRRLWVKVGALALRAVEAIDRRDGSGLGPSSEGGGPS